ncbi:MAG TPA: hypothetical protein VKA68_03725 [bacterium]|nr:hypothetical protein [bacterium]
MKRVVNKDQNFHEADRWDVKQQKRMTVEQRQAAAKALKERAFGPNPPDIRESERKK